MKYMKQIAIIFGVTCIGEFLNYFLPLPVPASIYGLILMLVACRQNRTRRCRRHFTC